jgi:hypothetical protein
MLVNTRPLVSSAKLVHSTEYKVADATRERGKERECVCERETERVENGRGTQKHETWERLAWVATHLPLFCQNSDQA